MLIQDFVYCLKCRVFQYLFVCIYLCVYETKILCVSCYTNCCGFQYNFMYSFSLFGKQAEWNTDDKELLCVRCCVYQMLWLGNHSCITDIAFSEIHYKRQKIIYIAKKLILILSNLNNYYSSRSFQRLFIRALLIKVPSSFSRNCETLSLQ